MCCDDGALVSQSLQNHVAARLVFAGEQHRFRLRIQVAQFTFGQNTESVLQELGYVVLKASDGPAKGAPCSAALRLASAQRVIRPAILALTQFWCRLICSDKSGLKQIDLAATVHLSSDQL